MKAQKNKNKNKNPREPIKKEDSKIQHSSVEK